MASEADLLTITESGRPSLSDRDREGMRMVEALLFASADPISVDELKDRLPRSCDLPAILAELQRTYAVRGVNLIRVAGKYAFRTAEDLAYLMRRDREEERKLSRAALETMAIIAYHQPVTRAEIEEIRGVSTSKGTLDVLLETGWVRMRGRRRTPGRPVTYGTSELFLQHFSLENIRDLPGLEELKGAGLLDSAIPASFFVPTPDDTPDLTEEEDPLEEGGLFDETDLDQKTETP
ncbi:SMC-Scp complex subunit ScpB [Roseibium suaedae]|uniref:Condensin subunit ScpB n=1 Tax=Roseibium suaedae TaxID=735517 RepID=A0A1M7L1R4_9HYPH|nr:SMC-Scp complex subunit ScpB [Roseibium suaedae]SHM71838.1 condensin subunit ScpB [Roseibium suaedae]